MEKIELNTGDFVCAKIDDTLVVGQILKDDFDYYLLQDKRSGSKPYHPKLSEGELELVRKYPYSWVFQKSSSYSGYDAQVTILVKGSTKEECLEGFDKIEVEAHIRMDGGGYYLTSKLEDVTLFRKRDHPDCCGCTILYNFCGSSETSYSNYKSMTDELTQKVKDRLNSDKASKVIHLSSQQIAAHEFVKKLGFIPIHTYKNVKSGNEITVYHLDGIVQNTESKDLSVSDHIPMPMPTMVFTGRAYAEGYARQTVDAAREAMEVSMRRMESALTGTAPPSPKVVRKKVTKKKRKTAAVEASRGVMPSYFKSKLERFQR